MPVICKSINNKLHLSRFSSETEPLVVLLQVPVKHALDLFSDGPDTDVPE